MNMIMLCGRRTSASPLDALGDDRPLLVELARQRRRTGDSPSSTAPPAPSAQRPAQDASQRGAPAGEPAAVGVARDAERGDRLGGVALDQAQRPAQRLQLDVQRAVGRRRRSRPGARRSRRGSGEPRSRSAAIAASAASTLPGVGVRRPRRARPRAPARRPRGRERAARVPALASCRSEGYAGGVLERSPADVYTEHCRRRELAYQVDERRSRRCSGPGWGWTSWRVSAGWASVYATTVVTAARRRGLQPGPGRPGRGLPDDGARASGSRRRTSRSARACGWRGRSGERRSAAAGLRGGRAS